MGLRISDIALFDFRNYERFSIGEIGDLTVFTGRNGVGKTNLLEALQLVTQTSTFRHAQISQLIREGAQAARVEMRAGDGNREIGCTLELEPGKKRFFVNGKKKAAADVRGTLPSVVFTPDDLQLAKKSSSVKRAALDEMGAQLARNYHVVAADYEKTLRYKNRLLKDEAAQDLVDAANDTLVTCGVQLHCYRRALFARIAPLISGYYGEISGEGEAFSATYLSSWDHLGGKEPSGVANGETVSRDEAREAMVEALGKFGSDERLRHHSLVGPHNDKVGFMLAGRDAAAFASQGQQRSIVLAWKLAEVEMVKQTLGVSPILLLDDVMSELDEGRRGALVGFAGSDMQTFITATDLSGFDTRLLARARTIEL